ncbi:hypothetical protein QQF64_008626 [Cirrhinus molitorella]|uniref:Exonuclease V n=1 Tax=Cirrhinus molitorella TaxID=172907 RepID=A0ABR3M9Q7_9TELE
MDASGSQQLFDDWDDISDSEFLNIPSEQQSIEPQHPLNSETHGEHFDSPCASTSSQHNMNEEALAQETVKTENVSGLKRKSLHENSFSPMQRFFKRHLSVTLLCDQSWCEMKTVYNLLKPLVKRKEMQRAEVQIGKQIHLSREREIQDVVPVDIRTREDGEAIKLLNMLHMIPLLEAGERVREFPVFGVQKGVFVMGVIDELMYNQKGELVLNELKTRRQNSLPSSAQDKVNCFQPVNSCSRVVEVISLPLQEEVSVIKKTKEDVVKLKHLTRHSKILKHTITQSRLPLQQRGPVPALQLCHNQTFALTDILMRAGSIATF